MRHLPLLLDPDRNPCITDFHDTGPSTLEEARARGEDRCPRYRQCWEPGEGDLHPQDGYQCLLHFGHQAVRMMHEDRTRISEQVAKFRALHPTPAKGFLWSPDRKVFEVVTDFDEAVAKVQEFAIAIMTGPPRAHVGASFDEAIEHAKTPDGAISLTKLQELEGRFGYNGGRPCDTLEGPCSCGATH